MYAEVLVEIKAKNINQTFTYIIPKNLKVQIGIRVLVPFGKQILEGFVLKLKDKVETTFELKKIIDVIDDEPVLNLEMLELGLYMSKKTICNLINCYQTMLPRALKAKNGYVVQKKYITYLKLIKVEFKNDTQKKIIDLFQNREKIQKKQAIKISVSAVKTLIKNGILEEIEEETYRLNDEIKKEKSKIVLNDEQKNAVEKISKVENYETFLLHGVTGSGKTEVYMHIVDKILKKGKEAIILVPEISLTPQLVGVFKKRFGSEVAILHSGLSSGEKYDEWRKIQKKEVKIAIGARSAIFAPFTNLGIIIIDEEHSSTYKQENNPKYSAIDIANYRAKKYGIPLLLGSATPSIESYTKTKTGKYTLIELKNRINNMLPEVFLVDMKDEIRIGNSIISSVLKNKMIETLSRGEQVILFLNRRGYTTISSCKNCGYTHKCDACDIPLTYHKQTNIEQCHYCGYKTNPIKICPQCKNESMTSLGLGTEKLEHIIKQEFKNAKVIRMDNDTTSKKGSHNKIIEEFRNGTYNVLIGTQMISKGLDFDKVTLVGIINADTSLSIPDFRSSERTFQLINQVSGRAGRSKLKGQVVIQGFNIDHYSIKYSSKNDYKNFYKEELNIRRNLKYSPYFNVSKIVIKSFDETLAFNEAKKIANYLKKQLPNIYVLGPSPSMIPKINRIYHMQIILKYKKTSEIISELNYINDLYRKNKVIVDIDLNPILL